LFQDPIGVISFTEVSGNRPIQVTALLEQKPTDVEHPRRAAADHSCAEKQHVKILAPGQALYKRAAALASVTLDMLIAALPILRWASRSSGGSGWQRPPKHRPAGIPRYRSGSYGGSIERSLPR